MPTFKFIICLAFAPALIATPIFFNTSTASITCTSELSQPDLVIQNGSCPDGYIGASAAANAGALSVSGSLNGGTKNGSFSASSSMQDFFTETNGTGAGAQAFTITFDWLGIDDPGGSDIQAQFLYNGVLRWSADHPTHGHLNTFPQESVVTIDESFTYGQQFSFELDISATGMCGNGIYPSECFAGVNGQAAVALTDPIATPEPDSRILILIALAGLVFYAGALHDAGALVDIDGRSRK